MLSSRLLFSSTSGFSAIPASVCFCGAAEAGTIDLALALLLWGLSASPVQFADSFTGSGEAPVGGPTANDRGTYSEMEYEG